MHTIFIKFLSKENVRWDNIPLVLLTNGLGLGLLTQIKANQFLQ